jgi:hypothetical protein
MVSDFDKIIDMINSINTSLNSLIGINKHHTEMIANLFERIVKIETEEPKTITKTIKQNINPKELEKYLNPINEKLKLLEEQKHIIEENLDGKIEKAIDKYVESLDKEKLDKMLRKHTVGLLTGKYKLDSEYKESEVSPEEDWKGDLDDQLDRRVKSKTYPSSKTKTVEQGFKEAFEIKKEKPVEEGICPECKIFLEDGVCSKCGWSVEELPLQKESKELEKKKFKIMLKPSKHE